EGSDARSFTDTLIFAETGEASAAINCICPPGSGQGSNRVVEHRARVTELLKRNREPRDWDVYDQWKEEEEEDLGKMMGCATRLTLSLTPSLPCKPISTWSLPFHSSQITYLPLFITPLQLSNRCALSSCSKRSSVEVVADTSNEFVVVNFYRFLSIKDPQLEVSKHLSFLQGRDIHGRIYLNEQGINALWPSKDALAYFQWLREDHRFSEILVQISPALNGHAFPRLKLRYKPSLVQLHSLGLGPADDVLT
ncbi:hypothetical protein RJ639_020967, partial [Escallonia herrerae]